VQPATPYLGVGVGVGGGVVDVGEREHGGLLAGAAGAGHAPALGLEMPGALVVAAHVEVETRV